MCVGVSLFAIGLFKKVYWADSLAPFVDSIFDAISNQWPHGRLPTAYEAWAGALAYTLQIYFDFSGYSDMALGIARLFNTQLPVNFNAPYQAGNMVEFWRRWHMSLSTFLRDYLYIPLGGNRQGPFHRYRNLMLTMLIGGLWHGASWNFVVWGGCHGLFLVINHWWSGRSAVLRIGWMPESAASLLGGALTFVAVVLAWVLFRATSLANATVILAAMFGLACEPIAFSEVINGHLLVLSPMYGRDLAQLIVLGLGWVWLLPASNRLRHTSSNRWDLAWRTVYVALLLCWTINRFGSYSPFLYYQF